MLLLPFTVGSSTGCKVSMGGSSRSWINIYMCVCVSVLGKISCIFLANNYWEMGDLTQIFLPVLEQSDWRQTI